MDLNRFSVQYRPAGDTSRLVEHGSTAGYSIQVVTGYDAVEDRYPVHIYVIDNDGLRTKLALGPIYGEDDVSAFARGWEAVGGHFPVLSRTAG
jgi:hypothetical protein